jgi:hypothetical protein
VRQTIVLALLLALPQSRVLATDDASPPKPPYAITAETTVIIAPLRADGTVDYLAAWNGRTAKGVTPDENGWLRFEQSVGGFPGDDEALHQAGGRIPQGTAPWTYFDDYLQQKQFPPAALKEARARAATAELSVWSAKDQAALADYIGIQKNKLDAVVTAAALAKWWEPAIQRGANRTLSHAVLPVGPVRSLRSPSFHSIDLTTPHTPLTLLLEHHTIRRPS